jgi:hypothetical protein
MRNKIEIVSKKEYSTKDLTAACEAVNLSMLNALPNSMSTTGVSDDFSMRVSGQHSRFARIQRIRRIGRSAAAVAFALLISLSAVLTANATVREAFARWWKEVFVDRVVYYFEGSPDVQTLSGFSLGWVPEGFVLEDSYYEENYGNLFFTSSGRMLTYEYSILGEIDAVDIIGTEDCELIHINEKTFEYYQDPSGGSNIMMWIDDMDGFMHMLNGDLSQEELVSVMLSISHIY